MRDQNLDEMAVLHFHDLAGASHEARQLHNHEEWPVSARRTRRVPALCRRCVAAKDSQ